MCVGAVAGSRIPIRAPRVTPDDYNKTSFHYIVLQGTVDCFGRVIDTDINLSSLDSQIGLTTLGSLGTVTYTVYTLAVKGLHILH